MNAAVKKAATGIGFAVLAGLSLTAPAHADPREVRLASHVSELAPLHDQGIRFAAEVEKRLPGKFVFKFYPNSQLGKEQALVDNIRLGSLEMANVASGVINVDRRLGLFDLPWLFKDRAHVKKAMTGPLGKAVAASLEKTGGLKVLGIYENGFRHVINSARPITTPADLEGLKLRVAGGKFREKVFSDMGGVPTKVSWSETFTAMQTGVVDGAEAAIYGFYETKMQDVQKYLSLTSHVYTPSFLIASNAFWSSLSKDEQAAFTQAGAEVEKTAYERAEEIERGQLAEMRTKLAVNEVDLPAFKAKSSASYKEYEDMYGDEWLKMVEVAR